MGGGDEALERRVRKDGQIRSRGLEQAPEGAKAAETIETKGKVPPSSPEWFFGRN